MDQIEMRNRLLIIASIGQFFCTTACMTSTSRMLFAFSRDAFGVDDPAAEEHVSP